MAAAAAESFLSMSPLATNDPYVINVLLAYVLRRYLGLYVLVGRVVEDWRCLECEPDQLRVHQGREEAGVAEHEEELQQRGRPAPTTPSRPPIYSVITSRTNKPSGVTAGGSFVPMGKEEGGSNTPTWLRT